MSVDILEIHAKNTDHEEHSKAEKLFNGKCKMPLWFVKSLQQLSNHPYNLYTIQITGFLTKFNQHFYYC